MSHIFESKPASRPRSALTGKTCTVSNSLAFWASNNEEERHNNDNTNQTKLRKCCAFMERNCCFVSLVILMIVMVIFLCTPLKRELINILDENIFYIRNWSNKYYWSFNIIIFLVNHVWIMALLPGKMVLNISVSFITQDIFRAVCIIYISNLFSNI